MDNQEILLRQYEIYIKSKDAFIDRTFKTNRFYIVLLITLLTLSILSLSLKNFYLCLATAIVAFVISFLWYLNQDAYSNLIRVKYSDVIEKIEEQLPLAPHKMEFEVLKSLKKDTMIFTNSQKGLALGLMFLFVILIISGLIPLILNLLNFGLVY